jgi:hypothetical protein
MTWLANVQQDGCPHTKIDLVLVVCNQWAAAYLVEYDQ